MLLWEIKAPKNCSCELASRPFGILSFARPNRPTFPPKNKEKTISVWTNITPLPVFGVPPPIGCRNKTVLPLPAPKKNDAAVLNWGRRHCRVCPAVFRVPDIFWADVSAKYDAPSSWSEENNGMPNWPTKWAGQGPERKKK